MKNMDAKQMMEMGKQLQELGCSLCDSADSMGYKETPDETSGDSEGPDDQGDPMESSEEEPTVSESSNESPDGDKSRRMKIAMMKMKKMK